MCYTRGGGLSGLVHVREVDSIYAIVWKDPLYTYETYSYW